MQLIRAELEITARTCYRKDQRIREELFPYLGLIRDHIHNSFLWRYGIIREP